MQIEQSELKTCIRKASMEKNRDISLFTIIYEG